MRLCGCNVETSATTVQAHGSCRTSHHVCPIAAWHCVQKPLDRSPTRWPREWQGTEKLEITPKQIKSFIRHQHVLQRQYHKESQDQTTMRWSRWRTEKLEAEDTSQAHDRDARRNQANQNTATMNQLVFSTPSALCKSARWCKAGHFTVFSVIKPQRQEKSNQAGDQ